MIARAMDALLEPSVVGSFSSLGIGVRRRLERWQPPEAERVEGLTVVASGVTSGIGRATVTRLAGNGARQRARRVDRAVLARPARTAHGLVAGTRPSAETRDGLLAWMEQRIESASTAPPDDA